MQGQTDTQTAEIFDAPVKRGRGRPSTGQAKTAAERMREHRHRMRYDTEIDSHKREKEVSFALTFEAQSALKNLARHNNVTQKEFVNQLILQAQHRVLDNIKPGSDEWREYFNEL